MSRRTITMHLLSGATGGGVLTAHILHAQTGGNSRLYKFLDGMYSLLGLVHSNKYFSAADLAQYNGALALTDYAPGVTNFNSSWHGTTYNVLGYLTAATKLLCNDHPGLTAQDVSCDGMTACKEIRFDGTKVGSVSADDCPALESIRYSENAEVISLCGDTNLKINVL